MKNAKNGNSKKAIDLKTIIENGGATLDKNGAPVVFGRGYQVSVKDCFTLSVKNIDMIYNAVKKILRRIEKESGRFCGIWVDSGLVYIDISENIKNRAKALHIAKARHQKSVYGWAESACLYC